MTVLTINDRESTLFFDGAKKQAWGEVRRRLGIPSTVKLGVNNVSGSGDYRQLYVKGSSPRSYLMGAYHGGYDRVVYTGQTTSTPTVAAAAQPTQAPVTPAPTQATPPATNGRFAVAEDAAQVQTNWRVASRADLLSLLRDEDQGDDATTLPEGFPTNLGDDAIVLDPVTGNLYFRA
jgi:hypothetical protein